MNLSNATYTQDAESYYATLLSLYAPPCILAVGTLGNLVSLLVWSRTYSQSSVSTYLYLAVLAASDMLVLLLGLFKDWMYAWAGYNLSSISQWACKLFTLAGYLSTDYSVWLIIAVTAERYIAVCHPLKTKAFWIRHSPVRVILVTLLVLFGINSHLLYTASLDTRIQNYTDPCSNQTWSARYAVCGALPGYETLIYDVWPYVDLCLYSLLPSAIIVVCNSCIIHTVLNAATERRHYVVSGYDAHESFTLLLTSELRLTAMLLTISFTFVVTTLPTNVVVILNTYWNKQLHHIACTDRVRIIARLTLATTVCRLLMYTNHSINFYLYCVTGYKFKQELQKLCHCGRRRGIPGSGGLRGLDTGTNMALLPVSVSSRGRGGAGMSGECSMTPV